MFIKMICQCQVEAKIDGTNWKELREFDLNYYDHPTDETDILVQWANINPQFDVFRGSLWLYSGTAITSVTGGLKLWYITLPADFTDLSLTTDISVDPTTASAGFPVGLHKLLAERVVIAYKTAKQVWKKDFEDMKKDMKTLNLDKTIIGTIPYNDGYDY